jgi:hypothetical protein
MATVILGSAALALDLTAQSSAHRTLQNWTDAAALAGARDCDTTCNAKTEVQDAIQILLGNSTWSATSSWATSAPTTGCTATSCVVTNYAGPTGFTNFSVSVSSPPAAPVNAAYNTTNYVEADVTETAGTAFAGAAFKVTTTTSRGHSVAYDSGPVVPLGPFGYALYSKNGIGAGNQNEVVIGNTYAGVNVALQSSGKSSFCAQKLSDGTMGYLVFGAPQYPANNSGNEQYAQGFGASPIISSVAACPQPNNVNEMASGCPPGTTGDATQGAYINACVASPAISAPNLARPTLTGAVNIPSCSDPVLLPGIYNVSTTLCPSGLSFGASKDFTCVTLYVLDSVTITFGGKGSYTMTGNKAWGPGCTGFTAAVPPNANDGKYPIYAPLGTTPTITVTKDGTNYAPVGTVYIPDGTATTTSNASWEVTGQVICGDWQVQSGDHPNPDVTYSAGNSAQLTPATPTLRLAE